MPQPVILSGTYLGGHPARERQQPNVYLRIDESGVLVRGLRKFISEPWETVTAIKPEGPDQVQTRFTATRLVLLGPLGLAFKKDKKTCFVVVEGSFGEFIFQANKKSQQEVRAMLTPWAARVTSGAQGSDHSTPREGTDRIERLKQLGELHTQGVLNENEFQAEKARVLAE